MSIRPVAVDVDPEEGVMLRSDFSYFADTLDCLLSSSFPSYHRSPVRYDLVYFVRYDLVYLVRYDLKPAAAVTCTI